MISFRARRATAAGLILGSVSLMGVTGCSQVTGLAGGTPNVVFGVQTAVTDVLTKQGTRIQAAPACTGTSVHDVTCSPGKTLAGEPITVAVSGGADAVVKISVGDRVVFDGPIAPVITEEGRTKP